MTNMHDLNEIESLCGYDQGTFASGKTVIILENGSVKYIDLNLEFPSMVTMNISGRATAMSVSNDFSILAIAIEDNKNAKISIFSLDASIEEEKTTYGAQYLPSEICISQAAEIVAGLSVLEEQVHVQTFDVKDGTRNCVGNIMTETDAKKWQLSFCPADEGVLCALGGNFAYLLRASSGDIENFSSIALQDVICHDWANDVNILFGSRLGYLHIYRETILLDVVNIKTLAENELKNSANLEIISVRSTSSKFTCQTNTGVILLFDSNSESGPQWNSCRTFIISDFELRPYHFLSFDFTNEILLYDCGNTLRTISIQNLSKSNSFSGDVVSFRHCVEVICIRANDKLIVTLDAKGYFAVFSKFTK
uniref:Uncharacterized protein n=1 Tax=Caenorhabditis japonica TaxID=281687 RepID=A0A8R1EFX7_CAEJA